jgi:hypothetical protein
MFAFEKKGKEGIALKRRKLMRPRDTRGRGGCWAQFKDGVRDAGEVAGPGPGVPTQPLGQRMRSSVLSVSIEGAVGSGR